jgi:hypothetical protein
MSPNAVEMTIMMTMMLMMMMPLTRQVHTDMLLEEIEAKVVATMRSAGMKNLEELAPTQSGLAELKFQVQKLEVRERERVRERDRERERERRGGMITAQASQRQDVCPLSVSHPPDPLSP